MFRLFAASGLAGQGPLTVETDKAMVDAYTAAVSAYDASRETKAAKKRVKEEE